MRTSSRLVLALFVLTGLWTWSEAVTLCESAVTLGAARTCCPSECHCLPSACGCSLEPTEFPAAREESPVLLPGTVQPPADLQQAHHHPLVSGEAIPVLECTDASARAVCAAKHSDTMLELHCVQIV